MTAHIFYRFQVTQLITDRDAIVVRPLVGLALAYVEPSIGGGAKVYAPFGLHWLVRWHHKREGRKMWDKLDV